MTIFYFDLILKFTPFFFYFFNESIKHMPDDGKHKFLRGFLFFPFEHWSVYSSINNNNNSNSTKMPLSSLTSSFFFFFFFLFYACDDAHLESHSFGCRWIYIARLCDLRAKIYIYFFWVNCNSNPLAIRGPSLIPIKLFLQRDSVIGGLSGNKREQNECCIYIPIWVSLWNFICDAQSIY